MAKGKEIKLFTGDANPALARRVAEFLGTPLGQIRVDRFSDGESDVELLEDVRGCHVVIIQPTNAPADHFEDLKEIASAARSSSAAFVTAVIPYFGSARKDRREKRRVAVTAKRRAVEIVGAGVQHVMVLDPHDPRMMGFFDETRCTSDPLFGQAVFIALFRHLGLVEFANGGADVGRVKVARAYRKALGGTLFLADKADDDGRIGAKTEIVGDVSGRAARAIDDECATGGTLANCCSALHDLGASDVHGVITHGKFVAPAFERLASSVMSKLFVGDSVAFGPEIREALGERLYHVTFAPLLGEAIRRVHESRSISALSDPVEVASLYRGDYLIKDEPSV